MFIITKKTFFIEKILSKPLSSSLFLLFYCCSPPWSLVVSHAHSEEHDLYAERPTAPASRPSFNYFSVGIPVVSHENLE